MTIDMRSTIDAPCYRSSLARISPAGWLLSQAITPPQGGSTARLGCPEKDFLTVNHLLAVVVNHIERATTILKQPLARLSLVLSFNNAFASSENRRKVMALTMKLLEPLKGLRGVGSAKVEGVCYGVFDREFRFERRDLMKSCGDLSGEEDVEMLDEFSASLEEWRRTVSSQPGGGR